MSTYTGYSSFNPPREDESTNLTTPYKNSKYQEDTREISAKELFKKFNKVATFRPLVKVLSRKGKVYLDLGDHINHYVYPLSGIPDTYGPRYNYEFDSTTGGPIRVPFSGESGEGLYTIAWMVDTFYNQIPFTFTKAEDVCHVVFKLEEYLDYLANSDFYCDHNLRKFITKAVNFFNYLAPKALAVFKARGKEKIVSALTGKTFTKELYN
jgi:hypothetical protein